MWDLAELERLDLILLLVRFSIRGLVRLPRNEAEGQRLLGDYGRFVMKREEWIRRAIGERTADEDLHDKIYASLMPMLLNAP